MEESHVNGKKTRLLIGVEKKLFVSCNGPRKNRVGRLAKKNNFVFFFWSKMCVLCMFRDD